MWLFTKSGFFSVVVDPEKPDGLVIRGRMDGHLHHLCDDMGWPRSRVVATPARDYRFRIPVTLMEWRDCASMLTAEASGTDNFKAACSREASIGNLDSAYVKTLGKVWQTMHGYQQANL